MRTRWSVAEQRGASWRRGDPLLKLGLGGKLAQQPPQLPGEEYGRSSGPGSLERVMKTQTGTADTGAPAFVSKSKWSRGSLQASPHLAWARPKSAELGSCHLEQRSLLVFLC